ncbi:type II secretion system protein [Bacteriovorax stolpii]|uniref:Dolichyl-phosphate-mannose--protein mannosyltransferase n=1 Tax=Bacteriovorax stolpii TaxID=960 RepID=A0A2K9NMA4_BACTC|nr:type II secretion system protein [Bacteriovorax stolpii]AUN96639.1 dolichyl-phosphate-mannose--protein mannosyltransferase [Bacteriovorax stolpii]QDK43429.1 type II secretion system protein [Bacteriovorax stolpii]TDP53840.1 type IV pilus assembly protein PilA [Bacteriovorax stolpii]
MKKILRNPSGFTLVELMVVVAIIGILSAIAVPNFKKYQAKSKQSEAKIQLAAVYSTEVGSQADYDTFGTCIGDLGYETPPKGYYIVGFSASDATSLAQINARAGSAICTATGSKFAVDPGNKLTASGVATAASDLTGTSVSTTAFTAAAAANISGTGTSPYKDLWRINEAKSLTNNTIGY